MRLNLTFKENAHSFKLSFGEFQDVSDGGYERGYEEGHIVGYEKGKSEGFADGEASGVEQGKQAEYDAFWDNYQNNGTRKNYSYAFYGLGWNDETFKPKYPIAFTVTNANHAFGTSRVQKSPYLLELDFSECNSVLQTFMSSTVEELGILNFSNLVVGHTGINQTFYGCSKLQKIEKIIMPTKTLLKNTGFTGCTALTEIRFEGTLYYDQNFQWCPFSVESMKSIISCLKNYSGTSEEYAYKLTFKQECWDALEADSTAPDGGKWVDYVDSLGWTT